MKKLRTVICFTFNCFWIKSFIDLKKIWNRKIFKNLIFTVYDVFHVFMVTGKLECRNRDFLWLRLSLVCSTDSCSDRKVNYKLQFDPTRERRNQRKSWFRQSIFPVTIKTWKTSYTVKIIFFFPISDFLQVNEGFSSKTIENETYYRS